MSSQFDRERVIELVGLLCEGEISEDEVSELETMLKQHRGARRLYHTTVALHRDLEMCDIAEAQSVQLANSGSSQLRSSKPWVSMAVAVSVLVAVSFFGVRSFLREKPTLQTLATVTDTVGVKWGSNQSVLDTGDGVPKGRIRMDSGTICLTFNHGVVMTVEGPADFEISGKDHVALHDGQIVAYVPDGAEGFTVTTDAAKVVDLGTEFAVATSKDGSSEVTVFDGEIELVATNADDVQPQRVVAGLAWRVGSDGKSHQEQFQPSAFESARTVIRQRKVIREPFRVDRSFPGDARRGWTSPWSVVPENLTINEDVTGIHEDQPLAPGTKNYLTVQGAGATVAGPCRLRLSRSFDSFETFDTREPYTIEFLLRLESNPAAVERIRIFGVQIPLDPESDRADWHIATSKKEGQTQPQWRLYRPQETRFNTLPLVQDQTYRFLIEVHPQLQRWRASISDGTTSIWNTIKDGNPLRLRPDEQPDRSLIGCELTIVPGSDFRFSMDAIRIQNNPTATQNSRP